MTVLQAGEPMDEELIRIHATAAHDACVRMTAARLQALHNSVKNTACLRGGNSWDRRAAAHVEVFTLLAGMTDDTVLAAELLEATGVVRDLVLVAGPAANGMILSSHQRLLGCLRAGDADGAALEMERHLRTLAFLWRLALPTRQQTVSEVLI